MVFIYSSSGELSAYTFQDNKNKYQVKQLDDKTTNTKRTISPENSSDKRNAYERSRKRVRPDSADIQSPEQETEEKESLFGRFLNIFSDDSEEEVE